MADNMSFERVTTEYYDVLKELGKSKRKESDKDRQRKRMQGEKNNDLSGKCMELY